jgi:hypothetical protein
MELGRDMARADKLPPDPPMRTRAPMVLSRPAEHSPPSLPSGASWCAEAVREGIRDEACEARPLVEAGAADGDGWTSSSSSHSPVNEREGAPW